MCFLTVKNYLYIKIKRPDIVDFILLVLEKKHIKLPRRRDVKDLIKDNILECEVIL